ncbi:MAG: HlyC/CorC family transporter [Bradymonadales bacterium]|nr:HlyC/CorC family transporter [Bradymonadales bacterium]
MDGLGFEILGIVVFVLLSGIYSGSETALTALGPVGSAKLLEENPRKHRALKLWVDKPFHVLTTILIGNNLVNIAATALATNLSYHLLANPQGQGSSEGWALALAIGVMTFLILTFGEITPKLLSKAYFQRIAPKAMRFVQLSYYLFYPFTLFMVRFIRAGVRGAIGKELDGNQQSVTEDDIEFMVNLGTREGSLGEDKERLLHTVFEYGDTLVKEVMIPRVDMVAVPDDIPFNDMVQTLVDCGHSRIPVYAENVDDIVGVFYAKDVLRFLLANKAPEEFQVRDYLHTPVFVPISKKVDSLLAEFQQRRIHLAIAVDEFGGTAGVVTLEDIIEEFFGEILDEFDQEEAIIRIDKLGRMVADARVGLYELEDELDFKFPEDHDYESLGGFLTDQLGAIPQAGHHLEHDNYLFTVLEAEPTHIVSVLIEPIPKNNEDGTPAEKKDDGSPSLPHPPKEEPS